MGYAHLTMGSVARRARTSEPVLYRRWPNKEQLVLAALRRHRDEHPIPVSDTGSLRGDLIAELTAASRLLAGFYAIAAGVVFSGLSTDTGLTPARVREEIMGSRLSGVRPVYQRAHDRGEIDLATVSPDVLAMPWDLIRHDMLLDMRPVRPARIRAVVDELFVPLLADPGSRTGAEVVQEEGE